MIVVIIGFLIGSCICFSGYLIGGGIGYRKGFEDGYALGQMKSPEFQQFENNVIEEVEFSNN